MKAFSPASFEKIASYTGLDVEIIAAIAAAIQRDLVMNRENSRGSFLDRLEAAVTEGFENRPSPQEKYPTVAERHADMIKRAHREACKLERVIPGAVFLTSEVLRPFVTGWTDAAPFARSAYSMAA